MVSLSPPPCLHEMYSVPFAASAPDSWVLPRFPPPHFYLVTTAHPSLAEAWCGEGWGQASMPRVISGRDMAAAVHVFIQWVTLRDQTSLPSLIQVPSLSQCRGCNLGRSHLSSKSWGRKLMGEEIPGWTSSSQVGSRLVNLVQWLRSMECGICCLMTWQVLYVFSLSLVALWGVVSNLSVFPVPKCSDILYLAANRTFFFSIT